ncbi:restriction endonuclease [Streptomyces sp. TR1341]|nr:restriction endonuclease [Streptomyces sp. TR1341]UWW95723.1 hypothetical protein GO605_01250 [Streptomyces murinus]
MVIPCKRYALTRTIASREMRGLWGAKVHFGADLAVFATTAQFSRPSAGSRRGAWLTLDARLSRTASRPAIERLRLRRPHCPAGSAGAA